MAELWLDAVGFLGAVMVRRLVGIAHVADMDSIPGGPPLLAAAAGPHSSQRA
jgi:5-methylthioribose kinase